MSSTKHPGVQHPLLRRRSHVPFIRIRTSNTTTRGRPRLAGLAGAVAAAGVWLVARYGVGVQLRTPGFTSMQYSASLTVGFVLVASRRLVLNLWDSEAHSAAALSVLGPEAARVLNPLMSKPSELIATGPVISTDLIPSDLS
jgi:hypothetical protein